MELFIGLDVSLTSTAACVVTGQGKIVKEAQILSEPDALIRFLHELPQSLVTVGLEAGPLSQWLHKGLSDAGFETVLMETRQVKGALKAMPIKTDRRDAEGIARLLQMGWFRPVHCKSVSSQETRALLSTRKAIQHSITNLELSLRGVLRNFGLKMGRVAKGDYAARVRELTVGNSKLTAAADPILRVREALRREMAILERMVRDLAKADPTCTLMMSMPPLGHANMPCRAAGVGPVMALSVISAIDDPNRFLSSREVGPWVGLTPRRDQSGERDIVGQITRAGDTGLRTALYQAATVMLHRAKPNWLTAWALRVAKRRGKKRATVALARRIGVILHRMWMDGTEFRFTMKDAQNPAPA